MLRASEKAKTPSSYVNVVNDEDPKCKVNFCFIEPNKAINDVELVIPRSSIEEVNKRCVNLLYGYFIGKRVVFPVVQNYVRNVWAKYGIERVMLSARGFLFFKFSSREGLEVVLANGPWMIRTVPINMVFECLLNKR